MFKEEWKVQAEDKNVPNGHFNTLDHIRKGMFALHKKHQEKEKARLGSVRGGSAGAIVGGEVMGECARKAHLRSKGIETPLEESITLMTSQGEKNEDIWIEELEAAGLKVKTQGDLKLELPMHGNTFYGSPDIVIVDEKDKPIVGLELKNLSAITSAKKRHNELMPDVKHLIQSAVYSKTMGDVYKLGKPLPYQLIYSSRSLWHTFAMPKNAQAALVANPIDVKYQWGKAFNLQPFHRIYYLFWTETGKLGFETLGKKYITDITGESIDIFYKAVLIDIEKQKNLGPRPSTKDVLGKKAYSPCNYCDFSDMCDQYENDYDVWIDHCREHANIKQLEREV